MTRLSVNINKVATLRNARGGNVPDVEQFAIDCEGFGAEGITVHPRPDERHIRRTDVYALKRVIRTEFNIEVFVGHGPFACCEHGVEAPMEEDAELGVLEMATRLKVLLCGLIVLCRLRRGSRQRKCEKHRCQKFSHIFF